MGGRKPPLYTIGVVAQRLRVHPQTLRLYEREGFVAPKRTNRLRLYSDEDIERLSMIIKLTREFGVNKAGVEIILRMMHKFEVIQKEMKEMMNFLEDEIRRDFVERLKRVFL